MATATCLWTIARFRQSVITTLFTPSTSTTLLPSLPRGSPVVPRAGQFGPRSRPMGCHATMWSIHVVGQPLDGNSRRSGLALGLIFVFVGDFGTDSPSFLSGAAGREMKSCGLCRTTPLGFLCDVNCWRPSVRCTPLEWRFAASSRTCGHLCLRSCGGAGVCCLFVSAISERNGPPRSAWSMRRGGVAALSLMTLILARSASWVAGTSGGASRARRRRRCDHATPWHRLWLRPVAETLRRCLLQLPGARRRRAHGPPARLRRFLPPCGGPRAGSV